MSLGIEIVTSWELLKGTETTIIVSVKSGPVWPSPPIPITRMFTLPFEDFTWSFGTNMKFETILEKLVKLWKLALLTIKKIIILIKLGLKQ